MSILGITKRDNMFAPFYSIVRKPGLYAAVDESGNYITNFRLARVSEEEAEAIGVYEKYRGLFDMKKKKHKKTIHKIFDMKENSFNKRKINFYDIKSDDEKREPLVLAKIYENGDNTGDFIFSKKQLLTLWNKLFDRFFKRPSNRDVEIKVSNEVMVYIALLKSKQYAVSVFDLVDLGMEKNAAYAIIQSLIKKGCVKEMGEVGRRKFYTCTIPKEKLAKMFEPVWEE